MTFRSISSACLAILLVVSSVRGAEFVLRQLSTPQRSIVRIGDVAEIRGTSPARAKQLAAIPLMPTPAAGRRSYLRVRQLKDMLHASGEDLFAHSFSGASTVEIHRLGNDRLGNDRRGNVRRPAPHARTRNARRLTASLVRRIDQDVRDALLEFLAVYASANEPWSVEFKLTREQQWLLASATTPILVEGGRAPWEGTHRFTLRFTTPDDEAALLLHATVKLPPLIVVAAHPITRGAVIRASDLATQRLDHSRRIAPGAAFVSPADVVGLQAKRGLREGQPVLRTQVRAQTLVQRGDRVRVQARAAGIRVISFATAQEDAGEGDLVAVEMLDSKERFSARVVGLREVEVYAQGVPASAYARGNSTLRMGRHSR